MIALFSQKFVSLIDLLICFCLKSCLNSCLHITVVVGLTSLSWTFYYYQANSFSLINGQKVYFLKRFLSFSKCYVSVAFISGLFVTSALTGSYTSWIWLGCALADPAAAAMLCCWAQLSDVTLRDLISGGFLLLIDVENAKPRRRVALWRWNDGGNKLSETARGINCVLVFPIFTAV